MTAPTFQNMSELLPAFVAGFSAWMKDNSLVFAEPAEIAPLPITEEQPLPAYLLWFVLRHQITGETKGLGIPVGARFGYLMPEDPADLVKYAADSVTLAFWPERVSEEDKTRIEKHTTFHESPA
jgi:hypothetical protein